MCREIETANVQKSHNVTRGKCGFTLVELSVVLALLAILTTMIISFSVLMSGFAEGSKAEYAFLEDHAALKDALCSWVAENDEADSVFSITDNGVLTLANGMTGKVVLFRNGVLSMGAKQVANLGSIDSVVFTANDKLIKCVTSGIGMNGERIECSFVLFIRCGSIVEVTSNG